MKKFIVMAFCGLLMNSITYGQGPSAADVLTELSNIRDQYGHKFDPNKVNKKITLIFVEGTNTMMPEIYAKFKGKQLAENVRIVGGMANVMPGAEHDSKFAHMADGIQSSEGLGKEGYSLLFDINSNTLKMLSLNKYSVVTVSKKDNKVTVKDYGSDRIEFLKAIRAFFYTPKS